MDIPPAHHDPARKAGELPAGGPRLGRRESTRHGLQQPVGRLQGLATHRILCLAPWMGGSHPDGAVKELGDGKNDYKNRGLLAEGALGNPGTGNTRPATLPGLQRSDQPFSAARSHIMLLRYPARAAALHRAIPACLPLPLQLRARPCRRQLIRQPAPAAGLDLRRQLRRRHGLPPGGHLPSG